MLEELKDIQAQVRADMDRLAGLKERENQLEAVKRENGNIRARWRHMQMTENHWSPTCLAEERMGEEPEEEVPTKRSKVLSNEKEQAEKLKEKPPLDCEKMEYGHRGGTLRSAQW